MADLVERAELDAAQSRIRVLVHALEQERQARLEADRAQVQWQRLAKLRGQVIGQLRQQLERQHNEMAETRGGTSRPVTAHNGGEHVEAV